MKDTFSHLPTIPVIRLAVRTGNPQRLHRIAPDGDFAETEADVLVLDLLPGEKPPAGVAGFGGALLVLTDDPEIAAERRFAGVLPHDATTGQIAAATAALAEGLTVRVAAVVAEAARFTSPDAARPLLTPRELEILGQIAQGLSNKSIARRLGISAHTVKYHLEAVFTKLSVRSRAEAVTRGLRTGLLEV